MRTAVSFFPKGFASYVSWVHVKLQKVALFGNPLTNVSSSMCFFCSTEYFGDNKMFFNFDSDMLRAWLYFTGAEVEYALTQWQIVGCTYNPLAMGCVVKYKHQHGSLAVVGLCQYCTFHGILCLQMLTINNKTLFRFSTYVS